MSRFKLSVMAALVCSVIFLCSALSRPLHTTLNWDAAGYFFYLPATFIYNDLPLEDRSWFEKLREKYDLSGTLYQVHDIPGSTSHVNQYTSGMAICLMPAFAIGHVAALSGGYATDGYSLPYALAAAWWSILIAISGMWLFRRMLIRFFSDGLAAVLLVLILLGTNYMIQVPGNLVSPHNYLFALFALFITATHDWHAHQRNRDFYLIVLTGGLAALIRPTEVLWFIVPLWWGGGFLQGFRTFNEIIRKRKPLVWRGMGILILIAAPQVIYWLIATGKLVYMSYSNPGEGLDLLSPHTSNFLFSFRKGWLIYTPLMVPALLGFFLLFKMKRSFAVALSLFFLINLYIVSSWTTWWYAQSFSQRAMIHAFPLLAIPLGAALQWIATTRWRLWLGSVLVAVLFGITVFFQWQYAQGILHPDRMTREYFLKVFGKTSLPPDAPQFLLVERPFDGSMVFSDSVRYTLTRETSLREYTGFSGRAVDSEPGWPMHPGREFTPAVHLPYGELTGSDHVWLKLEAEVVMASNANPDLPPLLVATAEHKGQVYGYRSWAITGSDSAGVSRVSVNYLTPEIRSKKDPIAIYIWHRGQDSLVVRDVRIRVYERNPL